MPPQSRSQRRRQALRQQSRPAASANTTGQAPSIGSTVPLVTPETSGARTARSSRRVISRSAPEPVDYTPDYTAARRDLRWIALWTVLLFAAMIALKFSGLV
jgi:hypothetical protein